MIMPSRNESKHLAKGNLIVGLDIGTSKITLQLLDYSGWTVWSGTRKLGRTCGRSGQVKQRVDRVRRRVRELFEAAAREGVSLDRVVALGVCCTTPTLAFVDDGGNALDGLWTLWCDTRRDGLANADGTNVGFRKAAALVEAERELFGAASFIADAGSVVMAWLTGRLVSNAAVLSQKFAWTETTGFDSAGLESLSHCSFEELCDKIPMPVVQTGEQVGKLVRSAAAETGLPAGIPVVTGGYDSVSAIVGSGLIHPDSTFLSSVGTSVTFYMCPTCHDAQLGPWTLRPHLLPKGSLVIGGGFEAGMQSIGQLHDQLRLSCVAASDHELEGIAAKGERFYNARCGALPFGGVPLRAPMPEAVFDTHVYVNEIAPSPQVCLVAMRRGVAAFTRFCIEDLLGRSVEIDRIHVVGGGTKSPSFCQLVADCCDLPVVNCGCQAAAVGAAMLAAAESNGWQALIRIADHLQANRSCFVPDPTRRAFYGEVYDRFVRRLNAAM